MKTRAVFIILIFTFSVSCASTTNPPFEWEQQRQSPNEPSIQLIEENREMKKGETEITYRLDCKGFLTGDSLEFWKKIGEKYERAGIITIDEQGKTRWKSKKGTGGQFSVSNLIVKGINAVAGREDADIVRFILVGNILRKGIEVAVYDKKSGQVAFAKTPVVPLGGAKP